MLGHIMNEKTRLDPFRKIFIELIKYVHSPCRLSLLLSPPFMRTTLVLFGRSMEGKNYCVALTFQ